MNPSLRVFCHMELATACCSRDAHHVGVTRLLTIATVIIGCGYDRLRTLLAPFLATLDTLLGVLGGGIG
jgi:hypothetical protein